MQIITSETPAALAAYLLCEILLANGNRPLLLLLSGGSALSLLEYLTLPILGPYLTVTVLDERFSLEPTVNNFAQIKNTAFYTTALKNGVNFIPTTISAMDTLARVGIKFEQALRTWRHQHPTGMMVATIGIGQDGHIAGLFPGQLLTALPKEQWVVAYEVPTNINEYTQRFSVTYEFLRQELTTAIVYVVGEDKKALLARVQSEEIDLEKIPATILRELSAVTIVTD